MVHRCENCLGEEVLREYLEETFADSEEEEISFQRWQGSDIAMLCANSIHSRIEFIFKAISNLTANFLLQNVKPNI